MHADSIRRSTATASDRPIAITNTRCHRHTDGPFIKHSHEFYHTNDAHTAVESNLMSYAHRRLSRAHIESQPHSPRVTVKGRKASNDAAYDSLLLLARLLGGHVGFPDDGDDLAKHDGRVAVKEGNARETLAILERIDHHRLLRAERDLRHLVRLERVGRLHLLAACLLAELDLARDVERLDLRVELTALVERLVLLVDHHVADARHVLLVEALDVQADVVTRLGELVARVVHLDSEDLATAWVSWGIGRHEDDLLVGLN